VGGLARVAALGVCDLDRDHETAAASLQSMLPVDLVGEEVSTDGAQERAEATPGGVGRGEDPFLQQAGEELLSQVL